MANILPGYYEKTLNQKESQVVIFCHVIITALMPKPIGDITLLASYATPLLLFVFVMMCWDATLSSSLFACEMSNPVCWTPSNTANKRRPKPFDRHPTRFRRRRLEPSGRSSRSGFAPREGLMKPRADKPERRRPSRPGLMNY